MGWANLWIDKLKKGETVKFRPKGNSMQGRVESGQLCTVEPIEEIKVGDVVLCKVNGRQYLRRTDGPCIASNTTDNGAAGSSPLPTTQAGTALGSQIKRG